MKIIVFLIIISLLVAVGFLFAFFWAVNDGQYEDDYTPSMRILIDDDMLIAEDSQNSNKIITNSVKGNQNDHGTSANI